MAGSHVWVTRFSIVHAHTESGYMYQRYSSTPAPGLGAATPGRVILTLRAPPVHGCRVHLSAPRGLRPYLSEEYKLRARVVARVPQW
jgi:hypothetical protein